jgi:hypothetical protein
VTIVLVKVAVSLGLMAWWAASFDGPQWVKNSVFVGAAVVAAFAPSYVDWYSSGQRIGEGDPPEGDRILRIRTGDC